MDETTEVLIDMFTGTLGGCAGILAGQPLDIIKVRLQSSTKYTGIWDCFKTIVRKEKVSGLYKGMASPLVGVGIVNSLLFGVYGAALRFFSNDQVTTSSIFAAGCASGLVNSFFSCPIELVKIRLQSQRSSIGYHGPMDCIKKIYRKDGARGFYRGFGTTVLREIPSYGVYFASYHVLSDMLLPQDARRDVPSASILVAGGMAGVFGWLSTYPFDVIKTRLQSGTRANQGAEDHVPKYKNLVHAARLILRTEGPRVFFNGMGATALRAFPTNATTFYIVVWSRNIINDIS